MTSNRVFVFFVLIQAASAEPELILPFLPTPEGTTMNTLVSRGLRLPEMGGRRPRHLVSILTLLWPQVVGPMHDGIIQEHDYSEIPKSAFENYLDSLRERSRHEVSTRQLIREIINYGPVPGSQILAHPPKEMVGPPTSLPEGLMHLPANKINFYQHRERRHHAGGRH